MSVGLCYTLASFRTIINEVLRELLDEGMIVYSDIIIYSETEEEYVQLVQKVHKKLKRAHLYVAINKGHCHVKEVNYLGYVIIDKAISLSPAKV